MGLSKWIPIIKNITTKTKCSFNYETVNNINTLAKKIGVTGNNMDVILANIDQLVASKEGMTYLVKSPNLVTEMRQSSGYTEEIRLKLLDSKVISEDLKYNAGLPCYLYYEGDTLTNVVEYFGLVRVYSDYKTNSPDSSTGLYLKNPHSFLLQANFKTSYATVSSMKTVNMSDYNTLAINFSHSTNRTAEDLEGVTTLGVATSLANRLMLKSVDFAYHNYAAEDGVYDNLTLDISDVNGNYFIHIKNAHDDVLNANSVYCYVHRVALY